MDEPDPLAKESWFNNKWRPAMSWLYFSICACDFIIFPIMNAAINVDMKSFHDWHPLTLQGGGLFHVAMGGIVGAAVWTRTKEKMAMFGQNGGVVTDQTTEAGSGPPQAARSSRAD